jgi:hypothetical protein
VVPFLGAAASFAGADLAHALPSGGRLAEMLASAAEYPGPASDPLSKIAQYYEEIPADRPLLVRKITTIFGQDLHPDYRCGCTDFFHAFPQKRLPSLIVTTNYDVLVERTLEDRGVPYLAISLLSGHSRYAGRYICYQSVRTPLDDCIWTKTQLEDRIEELNDQEEPTVLIYKIHGTAQARRVNDEVLDSIVLTESDYIEFLDEERLNKIPTRVLTILRKANLLFLGYSLQDWNFRVLLQRINRIQQQQDESARKHWACRLLDKPDEVEDEFWKKRGVKTYSVPLETFLCRLSEAVVEADRP